MSESISDRLLRERKERILEYVKQKLTAEEIADREGTTADYISKERRALTGRKVKDSGRLPMPFGLTDATVQLRKELGNILYNFIHFGKKHQLEVARDIGIPRRHQKVATNNKSPNYNWKLSQIERLARARGIDPTRLMIVAMKHELRKQAGTRKVGDMIEEWLNGNV